MSLSCSFTKCLGTCLKYMYYCRTIFSGLYLSASKCCRSSRLHTIRVCAGNNQIVQLISPSSKMTLNNCVQSSVSLLICEHDNKNNNNNIKMHFWSDRWLYIFKYTYYINNRVINLYKVCTWCCRTLLIPILLWLFPIHALYCIISLPSTILNMAKHTHVEYKLYLFGGLDYSGKLLASDCQEN